MSTSITNAKVSWTSKQKPMRKLYAVETSDKDYKFTADTAMTAYLMALEFRWRWQAVREAKSLARSDRSRIYRVVEIQG